LGFENDCTRRFEAPEEDLNQVELILRQVSGALRENGYDPVDQIVGYLMSGDPTYITSCQNARTNIRQVERDQILDELVRKYLERGGF